MGLIPIDAISGKYFISNYSQWKEQVFSNTGREFGDKYGHVTGSLLLHSDDEIKSVRHDTIEHNFWKLRLTITTDKETQQDTVVLSIMGNPSKSHFGGNNYNNLTSDEFDKVIKDLAYDFCLDVDEIRLTAPFEPSFTWVNPNNYILNEESFKGRFVVHLNSGFHIVTNDERIFLGVETASHNFYPKVYLPGVKFRQPLNSLRFEKHYSKIPVFSRATGIETWGDLFTTKGIYACYTDLLRTLDDSIIFDPTLKETPHNKIWLNEIIKNAGSSDFWLNEFKRSASDKTRKKRLNEYRDLSLTAGEGLHRKLEAALRWEADKFLSKKADKIRIVSNLLKGYKPELIKYDIIVCKINNNDLINLYSSASVILDNKLINQIPNLSETKRTCICCGKDINKQRKKSKYCSAKYVGEKQAKKCRNSISNKEHNKRKLHEKFAMKKANK